MMADVIRAQLQFDEAQYEALRRRAFEERISIAELVRRYVERGLVQGPRQTRRGGARGLLRFAGIGAGPEDLAEAHDDYLAEVETESTS